MGRPVAGPYRVVCNYFVGTRRHVPHLPPRSGWQWTGWNHCIFWRCPRWNFRFPRVHIPLIESLPDVWPRRVCNGLSVPVSRKLLLLRLVLMPLHCRYFRPRRIGPVIPVTRRPFSRSWRHWLACWWFLTFRPCGIAWCKLNPCAGPWRLPA